MPALLVLQRACLRAVSPHICVSRCKHLFSVRTQSCRIRAHPLQTPHFQTRSRSQVLGLRTSTRTFRGTRGTIAGGRKILISENRVTGEGFSTSDTLKGEVLKGPQVWEGILSAFEAPALGAAADSQPKPVHWPHSGFVTAAWRRQSTQRNSDTPNQPKCSEHGDRVGQRRRKAGSLPNTALLFIAFQCKNSEEPANKERDFPWGAAPLSLFFPYLPLQISHCPDPFITRWVQGNSAALSGTEQGGRRLLRASMAAGGQLCSGPVMGPQAPPLQVPRPPTGSHGHQTGTTAPHRRPWTTEGTGGRAAHVRSERAGTCQLRGTIQKQPQNLSTALEKAIWGRGGSSP